MKIRIGFVIRRSITMFKHQMKTVLRQTFRRWILCQTKISWAMSTTNGPTHLPKKSDAKEPPGNAFISSRATKILTKIGYCMVESRVSTGILDNSGLWFLFSPRVLSFISSWSWFSFDFGYALGSIWNHCRRCTNLPLLHQYCLLKSGILFFLLSIRKNRIESVKTTSI